jgi:LCP family protein required for cell wall assembly
MSAPLRRRRRSSASAIPIPLPNKRVIAAVLVALVLAVVAYTGLRVLGAIRNIDPHAGLKEVIGLAQDRGDVPGTLAYKLRHGQRVNILLLGYGGVGHDGAFLTDSIMVVSVQGPDRISMISIPRDTYVNLSRGFVHNTYYNKINVAYEIPLINGGLGRVSPDYDQSYIGAGKLASSVIGDYLGQPIDYWVGLDFTAFKKLVDAVGGVDVVNPYTLDDSEYPLGETNGYMHIHFDKGPLHLSGDQALIYVRERHADNDFGRSRRQQQVLVALKEKTMSVGAIPKLFSLLDALKDNVKTNMGIEDLKTFSGIANKLNSAGAHHVSVDDTNWQYSTYSSEGAYILLPYDHTLATLHHYMDSVLPDPAVLNEKAVVQFSSSYSQSVGGQSLAGVMSSVMHMIDFHTAAPATVKLAPQTTEIHDYSGGGASKTVAWMAKYFNAKVVVETPHPVASASAASPSAAATPAADSGAPDVVVVLGQDFSTAFDAPLRPVYSPPPSAPPTARPTPRPSTVPTPSEEPSTTPTAKPSPKPCPPIICKPSPHPSPSPGGTDGGAGNPGPSPQPSP